MEIANRFQIETPAAERPEQMALRKSLLDRLHLVVLALCVAACLVAGLWPRGADDDAVPERGGAALLDLDPR